MAANQITKEQFETMVQMLRDGFEAGALQNIEFEYPGVKTDVYPMMKAHISYSARPSQNAYQWISGTIDWVRRILR